MPFGLPQGPPAGQSDTPYWRWNPYTQQFEPTQQYMDLQQNGDPSLGTNVVYPYGSGTEHFAPGETPYTFLSAGGNYAGGVKSAVPGSELYNQLMADARTRGQQGILKVAALVGGGAALGATPWGSATPGTSYGTGLATATDAAYGALPEAGIGAEGVGAGLGAGSVPAASAGMAGWGPAVGTIGALPPAAYGGAAGGLLGLSWPQVGAIGAGLLSGTTGPSSSTQTSTNNPPAYLLPYLQQAATQAQTAYGQGNYVAPIQTSAINYGQNVLNGNYLNPESNPWLKQTFDQAAGAVTNQVQSNFGLAGRNVRGADAAGLATDKYSQLAAQIYGPAYQQERQYQQQVLPYANSLGAVTNPNQSLDDFIARLRNLAGGYGTNTSTSPLYNSPWAGLLGGLGLAASLGG